MKTLLLLSLFLNSPAWAHVPVILQPVEGAPVAGHFLGRAEVSRAVYSELTRAEDLATISWLQAEAGPSLLQLFSPKCSALPQYEDFEPAALLLKGEAPWKEQGESSAQYVARVRAGAVAELGSNFPQGKRPVYDEKHAGHSLWVGGEWKGILEAGLYTLVIFSPAGAKGNYVLGLNEKEAWTPDLQRYTREILPKINAGLCDPKGYSGRLQL